LLLVLIGIGAGLVYWKNTVGGFSQASFNSMSKEEVELLIKDLGKQNPMALKQLADDEELRKEQLTNLKELLALASEAQRQGKASVEPYRQEMKNIRALVVATSYDREINADKGPMPQFGYISEEQVNAFWSGEDQPKTWLTSLGLGKRNNDVEFQRFLDSKVTQMKETNPQMADREISEEETEQAKEYFAKVSIYENEFDLRAANGELDAEFVQKVGLQVKLQQAQFLARLYADDFAKKIEVTDEEVEKYIAENPQFDTTEKRQKAEEILRRAQGGDDFAELANEFSQDPGNEKLDGEKSGGLYKDVTKGRMVAPFEEAALALEPGQIAPNIVESDFGFHVIKLERKGEEKPEGDAEGEPVFTYDVRHILISTGYKDPEQPMGREMPIKAFVKQKLTEEKQKQALEQLIAVNNVSVPEDFEVPEVTEEQIKEMLEKQRPTMPGGHSPDDGHNH
jgi:parvulin-like peptidyl-prolyl isomerase